MLDEIQLDMFPFPEPGSGIDCWNCGVFNLHTECGTYEVLFPECKDCGACTELPPPWVGTDENIPF